MLLSNLKSLSIMENKTKKLVYEIVKAVVYALLGFFGSEVM